VLVLLLVVPLLLVKLSLRVLNCCRCCSHELAKHQILSTEGIHLPALRDRTNGRSLRAKA
jgi:hypothetical protein